MWNYRNIFVLLMLLGPQTAPAWQAQITEEKGAEAFEIKSSVRIAPSWTARPDPELNLELGIEPGPDFVLMGKQGLDREPDGKSIRVPVTLKGPKTTFKIRRVSPRGTVTTARIGIQFTDYDRFREAHRLRSARAPSFSLGTGTRYFRYEEEGEPVITENTTIPTRFEARLPLPWVRVTVEGFASIDLAQIITASGSPNARFLEWGTEAFYELFPSHSRWQILLGGGLIYSTMFVNLDEYGFVNFLGPSLSLRASFWITDDLLAAAKVSYTPSFVGFDFVNQRLVSSYAEASYRYSKNWTFGVRAELDQLQLMIQGFDISMLRPGGQAFATYHGVDWW